MIVNVSTPIPGAGQTGISLKTHAHTVTITNDETGVTYQEISGPAEPLEGERELTLERHRHFTTDGYLGTPV